MKLFKIFILSVLTVTVHAQGISFKKDLQWEGILKQAKKEHKMIFVNCFMKGGAPVIEVEKNVFPVKAVGTFYNKNFICYSVDMELLAVDEKGRGMRAEADTLKKRYHVNGYPTFLYLDSEGQLKHRYVGSLNKDQFILEGKTALDPAKQFYSRLQAYRSGARDTAQLRDLASKAYYYGDNSIADSIVRDYIAGKTDAQLATRQDIAMIGGILHDRERTAELAKIYVTKLSEEQKLQPENMQFMMINGMGKEVVASYMEKFIDQSNDSVLLKPIGVNLLSQDAMSKGASSKSFQFLFSHRASVDKNLGVKNYLNTLFDKIITRDEVYPKMMEAEKSGEEMDWDGLRTALEKKFSLADADRVILQGEAQWFGYKKSWKAYADVVVSLDKKYGAERAPYEINNQMAIPVMQHSNNPEYLKYALSRMQVIMDSGNPNAIQIHTYGNLLYRLGEKSDAIKWEEVAQSQSPFDERIKDALQKMKAGTLEFKEI